MGKLFLLLLLSCCCCNSRVETSINEKPAAQGAAREWEKTFRNADSIILISHVLTAEYVKVAADHEYAGADSSTKKSLVMPTYLQDGKVNPAIIKERARVDKSKAELINIFLAKPGTEEFNSIRCNQPHHSVIAYRNGKQSYIDICFHCEKINPSPDIDLSEMDFDQQKWKLLERYFKAQGIREMY